MAVLKVRNSNGKASLGGAKDYLERDGRNVECSTFNIDRPEEWAEDMQLTKELFDKTEGRQYYWIVQSFDNEHGEQSYNAMFTKWARNWQKCLRKKGIKL